MCLGSLLSLRNFRRHFFLLTCPCVSFRVLAAFSLWALWVLACSCRLENHRLLAEVRRGPRTLGWSSLCVSIDLEAKWLLPFSVSLGDAIDQKSTHKQRHFFLKNLAKLLVLCWSLSQPLFRALMYSTWVWPRFISQLLARKMESPLGLSFPDEDWGIENRLRRINSWRKLDYVRDLRGRLQAEHMGAQPHTDSEIRTLCIQTTHVHPHKVFSSVWSISIF